MLRKLLLAAVLSATTLTGFGMTPLAADANPADYRCDHFRVIYRHNGYWSTYGVYCDRFNADCAADRLRHDGFEVRVEFQRF
jgi:hypothetical protein